MGELEEHSIVQAGKYVSNEHYTTVWVYVNNKRNALEIAKAYENNLLIELSDGFRVFLKEEQSSFCDWINDHMQNIESVSHLLPLNEDGDDLYQKIDDGIILW